MIHGSLFNLRLRAVFANTRAAKERVRTACSAKGATHGEAGSRRGRNNAAMMTIDAALFLLSLRSPLLASHWQGLTMAASPYAYASRASASLEFDGDAQGRAGAELNE